MNIKGKEFYELLRQYYTREGTPIYGNFTFKRWLYKKRNGTYSLQFNIPNNGSKSIPQDVLIEAWNANMRIGDNWIDEKLKVILHNDCRIHVLKYLLEKHRTT